MLLSCSLIAAVLVTPVFADEGNVAGAEDAKPRMQPLLNYETGSITTAEWDKADAEWKKADKKWKSKIMKPVFLELLEKYPNEYWRGKKEKNER